MNRIRRIISLPPHIVLQKVIRKLRNGLAIRKKRWRDQKCPTYITKSPHHSLNHFVKQIERSFLPKDEILSLNQRYLKHEFNLLGSGWTKVQRISSVNLMNLAESARIRNLISASYVPIDWHIDFKSGYRWREDLWSQDIRYGDRYGADVKVPWELARMQHLVSFAWGYALEQNEIYLVEFQNQVLDFIAANPPRYGVNWVCTMDVGIRVANWLMAYDLFHAYGASLDEEFKSIFIRSIYEHGKHIFSHLEWDPYLRSNHYLANLAGLLFVAAYLPKDQEVLSWLQFAVGELQKEMMLQFQPDGSNFEASTSYHRLSAEMVLYAIAAAQELGIEFPQKYLDRMRKMADFIRDITKPDGTIVQFGDNDSGRFIKLFPDQEELDHRYLMHAIREVNGLTSAIRAQLERDHPAPLSLCSFPDFGLYIQRKDPWFLAIRCGPIGQRGNGGHAHNDQLSFELSVYGIPVIVDPGTYVYTPFPEERNRFRSTAMHNTLAIPAKEQNRDEGLFRMTDRAKGELIHFTDGLFIGEHRGFGPIHRRTLKILGSSLEGVDEYEGEMKAIYFHLAPNWEIQKQSNSEIRLKSQGLSIAVLADVGNWEIEEGFISNGYGKREKAPVFILRASSKRSVWKLQTL